MPDYSKYIGIPFLDKGRTIEEGLDCWGLFRIFYMQELGIEFPSFDDRYDDSESEKQIGNFVLSGMDQKLVGKWNKVELGKEQWGDGILIRLKGHPMHVGVMVDRNIFIHILTGCDSVWENRTSRIWQKRVIGIYRLEGQSNG